MFDAALKRALELGEIGVQVAVYRGEELVLDTGMGLADRESSRPGDSETLFPIFSVTKAATALALHIQAERGLVDYEAPLARYWPDYAANGKEAITVRHVLAHRAGVPQMPDGVTPELMADWDWMVRGLAEVKPLWPAGSQNAYLSYTFGWLTGEVVRRTDRAGRPFAQFVIEEVLQPLHIDGFDLGVPPGELPRVARLYADDFPPPAHEAAPYFHLSMPLPVAPGEVFNRSDVLASVNPAVGAVANGRSVARLFALIVEAEPEHLEIGQAARVVLHDTCAVGPAALYSRLIIRRRPGPGAWAGRPGRGHSPS